MRPKSFVTILLAASLFACHQPVSTNSIVAGGIPDRLAYNMRGTYSGQYKKGLLTLVINYLSGNTASGYDIHKGLRRNLNGTVEQKGGLLTFVMREPGGNPYDGTFFFSLDTAAGTISGNWVPFDSTKVKAGPMMLKRSEGTADNGLSGEWNGDLGLLNFLEKGICTLEYYPKGDSTSGDRSQEIIVKGSYEVRADTIRIDWQRNDHTPVLNMRLIRTEAIEGNDSIPFTPPTLKGKGVKFELNMAG